MILTGEKKPIKCKDKGMNTFRKRVKNVVTSKGIQVEIEYK
jgi:hypothetical protein